jgi:Ca2+-binding RTX toxin-like protein
VLIGGTGNDTLNAGVGATTMTGGGGVNLFQFGHVGGGSVTVTDFNGNDTVLLSGYDTGAANTALANAVSSNGSTTITLSDNTKITFLNVSGATSLTGHVISG